MLAVKHIVSAAVLLLIIGAGLYFFLHTPMNTEACSTLHLKIAAFGDSLVEGYGATKGNDFPTLLGTRLGLPVANYGQSGDTTTSALARIDIVTNAKSDIVIVLVGGNDALQRVPVATTKQNLSQIIETLQKTGSRVVLVGVMGGLGSDPYKPMFEDLAKTHHVTLVPNILSGLFGNKAYMSDEVHPNDAGYAKVSEKLVPVIQKECGKVSNKG